MDSESLDRGRRCRISVLKNGWIVPAALHAVTRGRAKKHSGSEAGRRNTRTASPLIFRKLQKMRKRLDFMPAEDVVLLPAGALGTAQAADKQNRHSCGDDQRQEASGRD